MLFLAVLHVALATGRHSTNDVANSWHSKMTLEIAIFLIQIQIIENWHIGVAPLELHTITSEGGGGPGKFNLTRDRMERLEDIGFEWRPLPPNATVCFSGEKVIAIHVSATYPDMAIHY